MIKKVCLRDIKIENLQFCKGNVYNVEYNPVDKQIYIYSIWGYTTIPKYLLDICFL